MQYQQSDMISGTATAATTQYLRVKFVAAGTWTLAGDEAFQGVNQFPVLAAGDPITVRDAKSPGSQIMIASGAITKGDAVTTAASGKVASGTGGAVDFGVALTTVAGDGDQVEVYVN